MQKNISKTGLVSEIKALIEQSKQQLASTVNVALSSLYWQIGKRVQEEILQNKRAEYGKEIILTLSRQLEKDYGKGWSEKQLRHCLQFSKTFNNIEIVSTLWRQLSWSHFKEIIYLEDNLKREFYIQMCIHEKWSVRVFNERIKSMLYERTALSKKPELTIENDLELLKKEQKLTPDIVFKDPYVLDFLGLKDTYSEKDLETSIIAELQRFIIELGSDFAFLARQKRITIDTTDYYIDLLFYHRRLKCLVAIDLKIGNFEASHKGQMELYLRYLEKHEVVEGENSPIGLILCSGKNEEHIELLQLEKSNIRVADYFTFLPSQEILKQKLHQAIEIAKRKFNS
jgi:predicted nuclease of restriction endonuclease-like (RecB) superfamily